jgi:hypothetical protein
MNLDDLTIGQLKDLQNLIGGGENRSRTNIFKPLIGKYVVVRSRNEGINAGYLEEADETGCILKECRRLWYHKPKVTTESWYEGVCNHGLSEDSKISGAVERKVIVEDYSIVECTDEAAKSIKGANPHAQN